MSEVQMIGEEGGGSGKRELGNGGGCTVLG